MTQRIALVAAAHALGLGMVIDPRELQQLQQQHNPTGSRVGGARSYAIEPPTNGNFARVGQDGRVGMVNFGALAGNRGGAPNALAHLASLAQRGAFTPVAPNGQPIAGVVAPPVTPQDKASWAMSYPQIGIPVDSRSQAPAGILSGATLAIVAPTQVTVWISEFSVDPEVAKNFVINELKVSRLDYVGGQGSIPASRWIPNSVRPPMDAEILNGGSFALVSVTNIDPAATHHFFGTFDARDLTRRQSA